MLRALPPSTRQAIRKRTEYLRTMPRMYAMAPEEECFPGCRRFSAEPGCRVYYMVGAAGQDCYIVAILLDEPDDPPL
jgi:hypothetical protein